MQCENSHVRRDIDHDMQQPAPQLEHRTLPQQPDHAEYKAECDQAVAAVIKLPYELKMGRALGVGHQVWSYSTQVPPDPNDCGNCQTENIRKYAPENQPTKTDGATNPTADSESGSSGPQGVSEDVHGANRFRLREE